MSPDVENAASDTTSLPQRSRALQMSVRAVIGALALFAVVMAVKWFRETDAISLDALLGRADATIKVSRSAAFNISGSIVPPHHIVPGGPQKDEIPALTDPVFSAAGEAEFLDSDDRVIGVVIGGVAKAYPLPIMNFHEIVNDSVGGANVAVTYCPLCDSVAVFDRNTPLGERDFGVSGFLYNSNVLMYDRGGETEFLWSQLRNTGLTGKAGGVRLRTLPVELTTWGDWLARQPDSLVLSNDTGHARPYDGRNPYAEYLDSPNLMFPAHPQSDRLPAKSRVLGAWNGEVFRAYPESGFDSEDRSVRDKIDGAEIAIEYDSATRSMRVVAADKPIEWMYSLWFSWYAMHPETTVFGRPIGQATP